MLSVTPSGHTCGARIDGVDFTQPLSDGLVAEIRAAWLEHLVVAFPAQSLTIGQFETVALRFGAFGRDPYFKGLDDHPHVAEVKRLADERTPLFAETWHSDWSFLDTPPSATMLYARVIPPIGGDTLYANQRAAYDALDDGTKARIEDLNGIHSAALGYSKQGMYGEKDVGRSMSIVYSDDALAQQTHPLVRVHPETGRKALFLSPGYTIGIEGLDQNESRSLLMQLFTHQARPEFVYRHAWTTGMLTMWDNRALNHSATGGYDGYDRLLQRITLV